MKKGRSLIVAALVSAASPALVAVACRSTIKQEVGGVGDVGTTTSGSTAGAGGADGGLTMASTGPSLTTGPSDAYDYDGPKYDGNMSCAPKAGGLEWTSCCDGVPCYGTCELHGSQWACYCEGIQGGCGAMNLHCCPDLKGCATYCGGPM